MNPLPEPPAARSARRKMYLRILPWLFLMYVVSYLDRANIGFVRKQFTEALNISDTVFGWGVGVFFIGYLLLEIPGALLVEHWSARKWFARILISWGLCSMAMAFVETRGQFYTVRVLLGFAEAGFFPGVIVYFTHWFPRKDRARAMSVMLFGIPISLALGAKVSAWIIDMNALGFVGWQWVFLIEGAPAVLLGVVIPFVLPDRPANARWLTTEERAWLEGALQADKAAAGDAAKASVWDALQMPTVWLLALGIFFTNVGGYAFTIWLKTAVGNFLNDINGVPAAESTILNWACLIYLCGLAGVVVSSQSSDYTGERKWHCVTGQVLTATFLAISTISGQPWTMVFIWLCLTGFFANFWYTPFWTLPTLTLTSSAAAVSIGVINMSANLAGLVGSPVVGAIRDGGYGDQAALLFLSGCFVTGGGVIALIRLKRRTEPVQADYDDRQPTPRMKPRDYFDPAFAAEGRSPKR